jgi:hypothetical protein
MEGMEGLLAALHIETHGVHDALNSRHGSGNGAIIIDVGMDRLDAEPNVGEKGFGAFRMPRRDSYRKFALEQMLDDVAAEKSQSRRIRSPSLVPSFRSLADAVVPFRRKPPKWAATVGGRLATRSAKRQV